MKSLFLFVAVVMLLSLTAPAYADLASSFGVYVYPSQGQGPGQQDADEAACFSSAQDRTGFNPSAPPPIPQQAPERRYGFLRGGAYGAGGGAAIGAIAGNAGEGAAIGAIAGGLFGMRRERRENEQAQQSAQYNARAQYQQGLNNFKTAFSACMGARGYVAR